MELAAAALGDVRRDVVGVVSGLEPDVEVKPVLGRAFGGWFRTQLEEGTPQRRVAQKGCQVGISGLKWSEVDHASR